MERLYRRVSTAGPHFPSSCNTVDCQRSVRLLSKTRIISWPRSSGLIVSFLLASLSQSLLWKNIRNQEAIFGTAGPRSSVSRRCSADTAQNISVWPTPSSSPLYGNRLSRTHATSLSEFFHKSDRPSASRCFPSLANLNSYLASYPQGRFV